MALSFTSIDFSFIKNELSIPPIGNDGGQGRHATKIIGLLRKLVCDHQGAIIEHIYWAAEVHKKLRLALDVEDRPEIAIRLGELDNDLPSIFQSLWRITIDILRIYFECTHRSNMLPRMCIKATTTVDGKQKIVDVFREDGGSSDLIYNVSENTGFKSVQDDGKFYICNNIPLAVKNKEYLNPRINTELAMRYKKNFILKIRDKIRRVNYDEKWASCWYDYKKEKENWPSCYKSTLIVPMTLINNHQSSKFIQNTMVGVSKDARSIYGFLCFDHIDIDYFSENDINVGYMIADLLSFYMINSLNFTEYSSTYANARRTIGHEFI